MMKPCLSLLFGFLLLLAGCRVEPDFDDLSSDFVVSTSLDKNASFGNYKTFFISDSVAYIGDVDDAEYLTNAEARQLVQRVKENMISRGYTFVGRRDNPDVGLMLSAVKDINVVVDYYPGWWDWYWPGCYWGCYPYYYPWTTYYSYTTGTVILNMYDVKNARNTGALNGIWNVTALGALGSSTSVNTTLGLNAIDQGFEQSPYIRTN